MSVAAIEQHGRRHQEDADERRLHAVQTGSNSSAVTMGRDAGAG